MDLGLQKTLGSSNAMAGLRNDEQFPDKMSAMVDLHNGGLTLGRLNAMADPYNAQLFPGKLNATVGPSSDDYLLGKTSAMAGPHSENPNPDKLNAMVDHRNATWFPGIRNASFDRDKRSLGLWLDSVKIIHSKVISCVLLSLKFG